MFFIGTQSLLAQILSVRFDFSLPLESRHITFSQPLSNRISFLGYLSCFPFSIQTVQLLRCLGLVFISGPQDPLTECNLFPCIAPNGLCPSFNCDTSWPKSLVPFFSALSSQEKWQHQQPFCPGMFLLQLTGDMAGLSYSVTLH